ncbi:MAG: hypothetical protein GY704_06465, partial [Phycisphaeraceae bacterium]|nr:hypothetical protein [Phycisphaeraceae bacterium]
MRHLLAFGILLVSTAFASGEAAIRVIDTEVIPQDDRAVVLRGDFEVPHSPHRWLAVYFQIR